MDEDHNNKSSHKFGSINALIRHIHGGSSVNLSNRRQSNEETSSIGQRSASDRSVSSLNTLPFLEVEKPLRKRSMFEGAFRIPRLMITGPHSSPVESLERIERGLEESHRRFSFGNFRRHSHSSVRFFLPFFSVMETSCLNYFNPSREILTHNSFTYRKFSIIVVI